MAKFGFKFIACVLVTGYSLAASAAITLYQHDDFGGRSFTLQGPNANLKSLGINDEASSVIVTERSWRLCEHENFGGKCIVLRPGSYRSLRAQGMNDIITSVRPVRRGDQERPVVLPTPAPEYYDWYHRPNEALFQAPVIALRAVYGTPEQRCWNEYSPGSGSSNAGAAVVGAIIGGIIGHQIGGGSGRDVATAGGAVAGAAIASHNSRGLPYSREVRRCENVSSGRPLYWDVTYTFRGRDHFVQMNRAPGATITVNRNGEPRE